MSFYFGHLGIERRGGYQEFKTQYVKLLPIPTTTEIERKEISFLVERILAVKKSDPGANASTWEYEIDCLVYRLYGLSDEEFAIVEGKS
jgi:hypothetical protein